MRVLFIVMAPVRQGPAGPTSELASARYRALMPAQQLARMGHGVQVASLPAGPLPPALRDAPVDAVVVSKSANPELEAGLEAMRARGVRVVADFCDDHFEHPALGPHFRRLAEIAHTRVASTPAMAEAIRAHTGRDAVVVTDPVEGRRGVPRFAPRLPALHLAWFGGPTNVPAIEARGDELAALADTIPVRLTVVTLPAAGEPVVRRLAALRPGRLEARLVPWSPEATWKTLEEADAVWIPSEASNRNRVKSPNRLVESLWAGRLAIADAIPSYQSFADLAPVGVGLAAAMAAALADPAGVEARLREAQRRIAREHSGHACGRAWARALGEALEPPLRLNLGCGDKILPGYVNVDVVESRAGMRPDVVCDLHQLVPFDDAIADEVLSVHVVEHFWRWEIRDVVREWVRVLKPGGRMVVECPNLESACRTFLENPVQFSREDQSGQRTMWVFYGDPAWKDPLMIHRWGYTPESLKALLADAGLVDVRQEPAQFKLREPRDMRVVGTKPPAR